jgi:hypothetical protein
MITAFDLFEKRAPAGWKEAVRRGMRALDRLYAMGKAREAGALEQRLEAFLETVETAIEELEAESEELRETGIEDYETGDAEDEAPGPGYWEPDMLVASASGI